MSRRKILRASRIVALYVICAVAAMSFFSLVTWEGYMKAVEAQMVDDNLGARQLRSTYALFQTQARYREWNDGLTHIQTNPDPLLEPPVLAMFLTDLLLYPKDNDQEIEFARTRVEALLTLARIDQRDGVALLKAIATDDSSLATLPTFEAPPCEAEWEDVTGGYRRYLRHKAIEALAFSRRPEADVVLAGIYDGLVQARGVGAIYESTDDLVPALRSAVETRMLRLRLGEADFDALLSGKCQGIEDAMPEFPSEFPIVWP